MKGQGVGKWDQVMGGKGDGSLIGVNVGLG